MIRLLLGENSFEIERALAVIVGEFDGEPERTYGSDLELRQIPDLLMGASLFAQKRLVVIKQLSENKAVWADFSNWLERLSDDIYLVLIEAKPDKRTKTYKDLQKLAETREFKLWGERDSFVAESWAVEEASRLGASLSKPLAQKLVERTGVDQWRVFHALEKLAVLDEITEESINLTVDASPTENIFQLFETALRGDGAKLRDMIQTFELTDDPYQLFGLLSGQAFQLAALAVAEKPGGEVAKDIGAHPFVLQKLAPHAERLGRAGAKKIITAFAEADAGMKTSVAEPWLLIERALLKIAA